MIFYSSFNVTVLFSVWIFTRHDIISYVSYFIFDDYAVVPANICLLLAVSVLNL